MHTYKASEQKIFPKATLTTPATSYYIHLAAEVDRPFLPVFLFTSSRKKQLIQDAKKWCREIDKQPGVISAVVFTARLIPPGRGKFIQKHTKTVHIAAYDLVVLIEVINEKYTGKVQDTAAFGQLKHTINATASYSHCITATNIRRINHVDYTRQGIFLFNYFVAESIRQNIAIWEYTAGWFQQETNLDNSTLLLPIDPERSAYSIINFCRWDKLYDVLPALLFKKSFRSYVLDNFYANQVVAIPVLYKLA